MYLQICCILTLTSGHVGEHVQPKLPDRFSLRMESIDDKGRQISDTSVSTDVYLGRLDFLNLI